MAYLIQESMAMYESKDGKAEKAFEALDWLPAVTHVNSITI